MWADYDPAKGAGRSARTRGGTCRQPDWPAAPTVDPCVRGWHFLTAERFSAMRGQSAGMRGHLTDLACRPFGPGSIRVRAEGTSPRRPGQERWVDPRVTRRALQHDAGQRLPHGSIRGYAGGTTSVVQFCASPQGRSARTRGALDDVDRSVPGPSRVAIRAYAGGTVTVRT